jgi:hypothetical protein
MCQLSISSLKPPFPHPFVPKKPSRRFAENPPAQYLGNCVAGILHQKGNLLKRIWKCCEEGSRGELAVGDGISGRTGFLGHAGSPGVWRRSCAKSGTFAAGTAQ